MATFDSRVYEKVFDYNILTFFKLIRTNNYEKKIIYYSKMKN